MVILIYPVETIDEGIGILAGEKSGQQDKDGNFPKDTVNYIA